MDQRVARFEPRRFRSTVAWYEQFRLPYPDRLVVRVAALAGLKPGDAVLDLGTGTGMLAVAFARLGMVVTAMDPEPAMLAAAGAAAEAAGVPLVLEQGSSYDLGPGMGPFRLVTMGRSFHWMDRAATLGVLDRIVAPGGTVALFHDAHPPVEENGWFKLLHDVQARFGRFGDQGAKDRRSGGGEHRRYEPYLFASAFSRIDSVSATIRQEIGVDDIVGRALSMSLCSPERLGPRQDAFIDALMAALLKLSPDGRFTEVAELVAVLACRPQ
ncbi:MAG: class I SAM-dependent methyltransferase [Alphaproteobacteria bacterium]|nr:class I SAM-dependent methyltransferase [Alphaproteobacteria bacterium]